MFAKVYQYKFGTVAEAKVAASFCADNLGKKISKYKFQSLNVMIGKEGDLSIFIKFDTIDRLKKYESESDEGSHSKNYPKAGLSAAFLV